MGAGIGDSQSKTIGYSRKLLLEIIALGLCAPIIINLKGNPFPSHVLLLNQKATLMIVMPQAIKNELVCMKLNEIPAGN